MRWIVDALRVKSYFTGMKLKCLKPTRNQGLLAWLLACPEKGFFVPIESESTDTLFPSGPA